MAPNPSLEPIHINDPEKRGLWLEIQDHRKLQAPAGSALAKALVAIISGVVAGVILVDN